MNLKKTLYTKQLQTWPKQGRHILAQYDQESIVVYQAYRPSIGNFASVHQYFGGDFRLSRMSWIKPNFLWMMHRSGWGTKAGQEVILAVRMLRSGFDTILENAVHSSFVPEHYKTVADWNNKGENSPVRLQWDPDHDPFGKKCERRALQLGLRGEILERYAKEWIVDITDISAFVKEQRETLGTLESLIVPHESVYVPSDRSVVKHLDLDVF